MRKLALLAVLAAALAAPSIAAAATPEGKLTGSATTGPPFNATFAITTTVIDGGTDPLYIGKENDKSGNCSGDSGTVVANGVTRDVVCAHFVASSGCCNAGSPKMRLAFETVISGQYSVIRITDNGASPDTLALGTTTSLAGAQSWVNLGRVGGGFGGLLTPWIFTSLTSGNFTVTP